MEQQMSEPSEVGALVLVGEPPHEVVFVLDPHPGWPHDPARWRRLNGHGGRVSWHHVTHVHTADPQQPGTVLPVPRPVQRLYRAGEQLEVVNGHELTLDHYCRTHGVQHSPTEVERLRTSSGEGI